MKREVPFYRAPIGKKEIDAVVATMRSGWLTIGPRVHQFEDAYAKYTKTRNAVAVNSATNGMHLALLAKNITSGEVITTPITFTATANVCIHSGARPVLADIEGRHVTLDPDKVVEAITKKTRAIMPVHYGGNTCNMKALLQIAQDHKLTLIEDAAHSAGASYSDWPSRKVGSLIDSTAAFSFYATKSLTTGEGGMITTQDDRLANRLLSLRLHGISKDAWKRYSKGGSWFYEVLEPGFKTNMTDIQAAMGIEQLKRLDGLNKERARIAAYFTKRFKRYPDLLEPPADQPGKIWHLYAVRVKAKQRNEVINTLTNMGVSTSVHFIPLHYHPFYKKYWKYKQGAFPVAEDYYSHTLSLPLFPGMSKAEMEYVADSVIEALQ